MIEQQGDYYAQFPQPRAERIAAAFAAFVELADSGGPGTTRGLIAAVERATSVTSREFSDAIDRSIVPGRPASVADVRRVVEALGFTIEEK